jgi:hypothetical protein
MGDTEIGREMREKEKRAHKIWISNIHIHIGEQHHVVVILILSDTLASLGTLICILRVCGPR